MIELHGNGEKVTGCGTEVAAAGRDVRRSGFLPAGRGVAISAVPLRRGFEGAAGLSSDSVIFLAGLAQIMIGLFAAYYIYRGR